VVSAPYTQLLHDEVKSYVYLVSVGARDSYFFLFHSQDFILALSACLTQNVLCVRGPEGTDGRHTTRGVI
jgi:hypothetical protein